MFTAEEIERVKVMFQAGKSAEKVAEDMGLSLTGFRARLLNSGYRIVVTRRLEEIKPVAALQSAAVAA